MPFIADALPIVPGQSERAGSFGSELTAEHRADYEQLNCQANVRRHMEWVQKTPMGDFLIVVFESDTPDKVARPFEQTGYDRWWTDRVRALHGFDPESPAFAPVIPTQTWDWHDERSAATPDGQPRPATSESGSR